MQGGAHKLKGKKKPGFAEKAGLLRRNQGRK
jgi:hypothetical protein